jgi:hypothetical protein
MRTSGKSETERVEANQKFCKRSRLISVRRPPGGRKLFQLHRNANQGSSSRPRPRWPPGFPGWSWRGRATGTSPHVTDAIAPSSRSTAGEKSGAPRIGEFASHDAPRSLSSGQDHACLRSRGLGIPHLDAAPADLCFASAVRFGCYAEDSGRFPSTIAASERSSAQAT